MFNRDQAGKMAVGVDKVVKLLEALQAQQQEIQRSQNELIKAIVSIYRAVDAMNNSESLPEPLVDMSVEDE